MLPWRLSELGVGDDRERENVPPIKTPEKAEKQKRAPVGARSTSLGLH
jgi:hypothetical protein